MKKATAYTVAFEANTVSRKGETRKRAFCRSSDSNVQMLSHQRAVPAFSPPRYRASMTRFRGISLRLPSRRFVLTATNQAEA